jgi:hypothetical protein
MAVGPLLKETTVPVGTVPFEDVTIAVRTIGPGRPVSQDEVSVVMVEARGRASSGTGATALAECGVATMTPIAATQVRVVVSRERKVFRAMRGRMALIISRPFLLALYT